MNKSARSYRLPIKRIPKDANLSTCSWGNWRSTPLFSTLESLKKQYPQAVIDVIVEPRAKSAYRVCPYVHEVLLFDFKDRNGLADYLNLLGIIRDREYVRP